MGLITSVNGRLVELGTTQPGGLAIGNFSPHRKLINWNIPNKGLVEMYINPQSLSISESKVIKETRTKGGYIIQYWGEALPTIDIAGVAGSGGIEAINVLRDIYRQEQIGFAEIISQLNSGFLEQLFNTPLTTIDSLQSLASNPDPLNTLKQNAINSSVGKSVQSTVTAANQAGQTSGKSSSQIFSDVANVVGNIANVFDSIGKAIGSDPQLVPTLAALATSVEMWYDGVIYRGYFKDFKVDERAELSGMFSYSMKFMVTRRTGTRLNGFPWQRSVEYGPANSDTVPLSFGATPITAIRVGPPQGTRVQPEQVKSPINSVAPSTQVSSTSRRKNIQGK